MIKLAKGLVELFYPLVEASLFDAAGHMQDSFNTFSTSKEDQALDVASNQVNSPFLEVLVGGKQVRCIVSPIYEGSQLAGYLRIRYDLSAFKTLQEQLEFLIQPSAPQRAVDPWKQSIDQIITLYLEEQTITLQAMTNRQKRELISRLQEKGLFDFKESSAYVAARLQISRATVYNYLKAAAEFRRVCVHQVDAFTSEKFGGNPAGVVLDADDLDVATMRKIARELNLSETAYVSPSKKAAFQMRYFTPTGHEVGFCGHSTVGALYMIAKEKRFGIEGQGSYQFDVETHCGVLQMEVDVDVDEEIKLAYNTPEIDLQETAISHRDVSRAAGFDESLIDTAYPVMYEKTNRDLFVVIRSLKALKKIECDSRSLAQFSKQHDIVALCLFCPSAFDAENQFHMRCYAPAVGIAEDPFTGSVLGGLTAYVDTFGLLPKGSDTFRVEQGHFIERPGVVRVAYSKRGKTYRAKVFAQAVHCFSTAINL
ncbi:MAG: PhzF family phenazine biosynthesis isomerase [Verrucomicrobia bacterium]|nr:PhzF family phenazine biosynthesis isomerase [Verrucomicrobiota bacterium]